MVQELALLFFQKMSEKYDELQDPLILETYVLSSFLNGIRVVLSMLGEDDEELKVRIQDFPQYMNQITTIIPEFFKEAKPA